MAIRFCYTLLTGDPSLTIAYASAAIATFLTAGLSGTVAFATISEIAEKAGIQNRLREITEELELDDISEKSNGRTK